MGQWGAGLFDDVLTNIIANVICVGTPVLVAVVLYRFHVRRRLERFFGITDGRPGAVQIRLSTLFVKPGGTLGPLTIRTGFVGPAIIAGEYEYAINLATAIQGRPLVGALQVLTKSLGITAIDQPVLCRIDRSLDYIRPGDPADSAATRPVDFVVDTGLVAEIEHALREHSSFVLVGSPVYNLLTHYVLSRSDEPSRVEFVEAPGESGHQASAIKIRNFHLGHDHVFSRQVTTLDDGRRVFEEYFVLQKIENWNHTGTTVFICAGNSVAATAAALARLTNWQRLVKEFGLGSFTTVYLLRTTDRELAGTDGPATLDTATRVWPPEH